jgi:hypothetical protein
MTASRLALLVGDGVVVADDRYGGSLPSPYLRPRCQSVMSKFFIS